MKIEADNKKEDIKAKERELAERDQTISDKEKKIDELKEKTRDLEKMKFVLDYKIKELRREVTPRKEIIGSLFASTTKMEQEVKFF